MTVGVAGEMEQQAISLAQLYHCGAMNMAGAALAMADPVSLSTVALHWYHKLGVELAMVAAVAEHIQRQAPAQTPVADPRSLTLAAGSLGAEAMVAAAAAIAVAVLAEAKVEAEAEADAALTPPFAASLRARRGSIPHLARLHERRSQNGHHGTPQQQ
eukprot:CAMPEP_0115862416 /NCGR_PEP_ID=MMETSP0287-20121206/18162_1 /TAXON_ID=412157 /ORGANISM="Chrysochromulina rotalis, Strain UIO044" /LENGTH=157 /DNA_ID=CAMNT_0003316831 /DNA_START=249 /DNA_END=722 /DNA_ORIENTATION=-